jgi:HEAT repeat protein
MEGIFGLLAIGAGASITYLVLWFRFRERAAAWQKAARAAGLTNVESSGFMGWETRLTGEAGPLRVRLQGYQHGKSEKGTRVVVGGLRHGAYALMIRAEGIATAIEKTFGERETVLGDEDFDSAAYIQGAPALIRAVLDADTRRLIGRVLAGKLRVEGSGGVADLSVRAGVWDGELQVDIRESLFAGVLDHLPGAVLVLLDLAKRLARPDDLAAAIAANTRREMLAPVRLANLQLLAKQYPSHAATREVLLAALGDDDAEVRLQAAIALGPDGRAVLLESATRENIEDRLAARAIAELGKDFPVDLAIDRLTRARRSEEPSVARACIDLIGRAGTAEAIETLAGVLEDAEGDLAVAAAGALGSTPSEVAERALVRALGHSRAEVRIAASDALGRIGTPLSVAPLRECAGAHPLDGALRRAARQAIAGIQARVSGASPGQLSLATEGAGQVSLADEDQRGQVSLEPAAEEPHPSEPVQPGKGE